MAERRKTLVKKAHGIVLKKKFGQHFLRDQSVVDQMLTQVDLEKTSVLEIGPGDGFLTRSILTKNISRLLCFEIDNEWVTYLRNNLKDDRLEIKDQNFLDINFDSLKEHAPWLVLSNLPYQVTFPILRLFQQHRHLIREGVVMVQEEVAQKILKTSGRGYGFISLFFQHYFQWKLLDKVLPESFEPPPKVFSRLLYFKPKKDPDKIPDEEEFWRFVKICFHSPRRTVKNNLISTHIAISTIPDEILSLRAQQMKMKNLLNLWDLIR